MKNFKYILFIGILMTLQSCIESGEIQIQNNISQVKILDVKWGDHYLSTELLPGETSEQLTIKNSVEKLPSSQKVSFKMTANNKTIYLETQGTYLLDEDDDLLIILTDQTIVQNPN